MAFCLEEIVPWGRSSKEYVRMFSLTDADLEKKILGCGDGPASFNAAMRWQGKRVVSIDPLYQFSAEQIRKSGGGSIPDNSRTTRCQPVFLHLDDNSLAARVGPYSHESDGTAFPRDLRARKGRRPDPSYDRPSRRLPRRIRLGPVFPSALHIFRQLSLDFHCRAVAEMCRVAREVRLFPLLDHGGQPSPHVEPVCRLLKDDGFDVSIESVDYRFQRGGNQMMRVLR